LTEDTNMQKVVYQCTNEVKLWIVGEKHWRSLETSS